MGAEAVRAQTEQAANSREETEQGARGPEQSSGEVTSSVAALQDAQVQLRQLSQPLLEMMMRQDRHASLDSAGEGQDAMKCALAAVFAAWVSLLYLSQRSAECSPQSQSHQTQ